MTTIAWRRDSNEIGADRQNSYHKMPVDKLHSMPGGSVVGGAGAPGAAVLECIKYLEGGGDKPDLTDATVELLRVYPNGRAEVIFNAGIPQPILLDYFAVGSGADYAMGAMCAGADVRSALQCAHEHDASTGPAFSLIAVGRGPHATGYKMIPVGGD